MATLQEAYSRVPAAVASVRFTQEEGDKDNDKDHSSSQFPVHKALTCPEGQSAWALAPSLFGEKFSACRNNLFRYTCSDLVPLEMSEPVPVLEIEMWLTQCEECRWSTVCCFVGLMFEVALFLLRINFRLFGRK